ncbi:hypothetical protein E1B28_009250 [Marasmius oreades]|uniref:Phosphoglycerate mutase-like protein n=1 Tax=Marasmius oreades TaxID=181124 RepID=A0A9P7S0M2_9AGAR|nr:uncharacterized protein E1B28_009250 [Marasmius oreades]KAG7092948.1 hypothetical protein E1B28_009250 [Marasmius oreades]
MPSARLYIIRHGETDENRSEIIQGHKDTQLNVAGLSQASVVANTMEKIPLTEVWSSDLQRAVKTAQIIIEKHPGLEISTSKALRERHLGVLEGKHFAARSKVLATFPGGVDPSAERVEAMEKRVMYWWDTEVLGLMSKPVPPPVALVNDNGIVHEHDKYTHDPSNVHHVLVVSHGGFIGSLVRKLVETGRIQSLRKTPMRGSNWVCHNTSITTIDVGEDGKGTLVKYADIAHMLEAVKEGKVATRNADVPQEAMNAVSGRH